MKQAQPRPLGAQKRRSFRPPPRPPGVAAHSWARTAQLLKDSRRVRTHLGLGKSGCPVGRQKIGAGALLRTDKPVQIKVGLQVLSPKNCPLKVKNPSVPTLATHDFICEAPGTAQTHKEHKGESTERGGRGGAGGQLQCSPHPVQVL